MVDVVLEHLVVVEEQVVVCTALSPNNCPLILREDFNQLG